MGKALDLTGQKFGKLIVKQKTLNRALDGSVLWQCICECYNSCIVATNNLTTSHTKSCGRCPRVKNLIGFKNGRLTVLEITNEKSGNDVVWKCLCSCGNITKVAGNHLTSKIINTKSCGCLAKEITKRIMTTHGMHKTPTYRTWVRMIERCYKPNSTGFEYYGGRGIYVCDHWLESFENFYVDMGPRPIGKSLDRIDTNGNYTLNNCKWSSTFEQANNRRNNVIINHEGQIYTRGQLAKKYNIPTSILTDRLKRNWTLDDALKKPIKEKGG